MSYDDKAPKALSKAHLILLVQLLIYSLFKHHNIRVVPHRVYTQYVLCKASISWADALRIHYHNTRVILHRGVHTLYAVQGLVSWAEMPYKVKAAKATHEAL